jgi:hypothetical protein
VVDECEEDAVVDRYSGHICTRRRSGRYWLV